jgi:translation initiation factor IF-2
MSKTNVQATTGALAASTNDLLVRIRESRKQLQASLGHLRDVEGRIKANLQKERDAARAAEADVQGTAVSDSPGQGATSAAAAPARGFRENRPRPAREGQGAPGGRSFGDRSRDGAAPRGPGRSQGARTGGFDKDKDAPAPQRGAGRTGAARGPRNIDREIAPVIEKERVSNYDPKKKLYNKKPEDDSAKKNKKTVTKQRGSSFGMDDENFRGGRRPKKRMQSRAPIEKKVITSAVVTTDQISIKELAELIGKPGAAIIKQLFMLGNMCTINSEIDYDTAALVSAELGVELTQELTKTAEEVMLDVVETERDSSGDVERPPVVTIMGHVDHGKTSLLDAIRKTRVTSTEAGGITQHIGAYNITVHDKSITFIDTPGHAAFTAMRARGAQVTDVAILVVAADDGVMPQTVEAINHIKAANVPMIVAINKCDLPDANPDRVLQELSQYGVMSEEWGGENIMVRVSATHGDGLEDLLNTILLVAEVEELKANPNNRGRGTVIEAKLDKGRGPVATVLVRDGTLRTGDYVVAGGVSGRIRAMVDDLGQRVEEAGPSIPVEVIGWSDVPDAGDPLYVVEDERLAKKVAEERREKIKAEQMRASARVSLDDFFNRISEGETKELKLVIKADVQGSAEAVRQSLERLSNDEVRVVAIHTGVGAITENDVLLASTGGAVIIGFNVRPDNNGREAAERENVDIRLYRVIYNAIEDVEKAMKGMLSPTYKEVVTGHAEVRDVFTISSVGAVAGSYVTDGEIQRGSQVRLLRDSVVVFEGKIASLRRFKDDVREVRKGYECGITLDGYNDVKEGDVIEAFKMEEIPVE